MGNKPQSFDKKKWLTVVGLGLLHPILLSALFPIVGEPANLVTFVGPLLATWLFGWQIGIPIALTNAVISAIVFSILGGQGADGRPMGVVFFLAVSGLCLITHLARRFVNKSKLMKEELENLRRS